MGAHHLEVGEQLGAIVRHDELLALAALVHTCLMDTMSSLKVMMPSRPRSSIAVKYPSAASLAIGNTCRPSDRPVGRGPDRSRGPASPRSAPPVLSRSPCAADGAAQKSTVQYSTVRYSTLQYSTIQCSTV
eukprot:8542496-Pyramimonas_sp.AAC.1